jgi:phosphatidylglycerophosphate synthase
VEEVGQNGGKMIVNHLRVSRMPFWAERPNLMIVAKQVADVLTLLRVILALFLAWLGFTQGDIAVPLAAWLLVASWTSDSLDGPLARRSRVRYHTWIGDHDLEIDMMVAGGLLIFMTAAGFVDPIVAALYLLFWSLYFIRSGVPRSVGMLFQAPIYGWFIWTTLNQAPPSGWILVGWILTMLVITWPKFPREIVPGFLSGMGDALVRDERDRNL